MCSISSENIVLGEGQGAALERHTYVYMLHTAAVL